MNEGDDASAPDPSAPDPGLPEAGVGSQPAAGAPARSRGGPDGEQRPHRYQRQGLLGVGGMGRVFAAHDARLRRQVALKVASTPELAASLAREAWITAQLEHPGIVAVYDAGETDGQAWYAMRLIRGRTLRERLAGCPDLAARLALLPHLHSACQAVAYAHSMGLVHRDLKPSNVMVGEFGETQVADWGLARPVDEALADWQRIANDTPLGAAGTARYMSPEQARGAPGGFRSDVYCLGAVLYELLAGQAPPDAAGVGPELSDLPDDVPRELVAVARRCLAPDAQARYSNAEELAADLDRWLSGRRVHAHAYQPHELLARLLSAWRAPLLVAGLGAAALAAVAVVGVGRIARERATAEANLAVALTQQALAALAEDRVPEARVLAAHALGLAPSPEARGVLAASSRADAELVERIVLPTICRHTGVVAPDASALACHAGGKLEVWSLDPLARTVALDLQATEPPVWIGSRLLVATPDGSSWVDGDEVSHAAATAGWPLGTGDLVFSLLGTAARILRPDDEPLSFATCTATRPTTAAVRGELVVGCDDGVLRSYGPDGAVRLELPLHERPGWSTVVGVPEGLLVGRLDGAVQALLLPEGRWGPPLSGFAGPVRALQPVPGSRLALALGERGGPRIWNTDVEAWVGSLPAGASRMAAGSADGEVLLLGENLDRWRLSPAPRPALLQFEAGVSQVTISPDGEEVAVALGTGEVIERQLSDGRELRRWRWTDGVAKCVTYGLDGVLLAGAMGTTGQLLGPESEVRALAGTGPLRRAGRLADGRVWTLSYAAAYLVDPASGSVLAQRLGAPPVDGSSSADLRSAAIVDLRGGIWYLDGDRWHEIRRVPDAFAVDIGAGGSPLVTARRREVCVDERCVPIDDDVVDVALVGERVAVATMGGSVRLLDVATSRIVAVLGGHAARVSSVEFGPEGRWLASGSWDGTARLWDLDALDAPAEVSIARAEAAWGIGLEEALGKPAP